MVNRLDNWPLLLSAYLTERRTVPFAVHSNDCMSFVAKAVEAVTGHDFFQDYSDYTDEESAALMLSENGGCVGIISTCLGHRGSPDVLKAGRGDVVVARLPDADGSISVIGGIVDDSGLYFCTVTRLGLQRHRINLARRYWSY